MIRFLAILALIVGLALHKRPPGGDGPNRPGGTPDGSAKPSTKTAKVDASTVDEAQDTTAEIAEAGRPGGQSGQPSNPPGQPRSQWDNVQGSPPRPENMNVSPGRRVHILDGDGDGVGGGHAPGIGLPNKTEFPEWDDDVIINRVEDVARNPDQPPVLQDNGRWVARGRRDGVDIEVVINPDGSIWTAYPTGGTRESGVTKNDDEGNPRTDWP